MKKFFYALGLTLTCGLVANAALPQPTSVMRTSIDKEKIEKANLAPAITMERVDGKKKVKGAPATKNDYIGAWQWSSRNPISSANAPHSGIMDISEVPGTDKLRIQGFEYFSNYYTELGGLEGYFKDGRLYIPNQMVYDREGVQYQLDFVNFTVVPTLDPTDGETYLYFKESPNDFFFSFDDDGVMISGANFTGETEADYAANYCMAADLFVNMDNEFGVGYYFYWAASLVEANVLVLFEFDADQWEEAGIAKYKDPLFSELFTQEVPEYDVPLYRNKYNSNRYLLLDPYGASTPYGDPEYPFNESGEEGYLVFNMDDPDCVLVEPLVYALTMTMYESEEDDGTLNQIYPYNQEAYYVYFQEETTENIINIFDQDDKITSFFDAAQLYVGLYNMVFDAIPMYGWTSMVYYPSTSQSGYILLPADYDSVKGVIGDEANGPVEYFNLQGVRVANPEKGQIVIVRQGNKASKYIAR